MPDVGNDAMRQDDDDLRLTLEDETRRRETDQPRDTGHTGGGGSLGHDQPPDVVRDTENRNATGSEDDPVMPQDDSTLNTKI
jgi:hypothetical protein